MILRFLLPGVYTAVVPDTRAPDAHTRYQVLISTILDIDFD